MKFSYEYTYALNFYHTKSKFGIPNLNLLYKIQIWYTKSRFGNPKYIFGSVNMYFGIPNLDLVYQFWIWYTNSGFGRIEVKGISLWWQNCHSILIFQTQRLLENRKIIVSKPFGHTKVDKSI